jgi:O-antigen/teichoic acid export membrane protein
MNKIKHILSSRLFKNFTLLVSGTLAAQIISLVCMPIITRLYDQKAFGILAIFQSVLSIAYAVGVLGYHEPIIIEKDDDRAKSIVKLCTVLAFMMALLVVAVLSVPLPYFLPYQNLKIILGAGIFLQLMNLVYTCWNIRTQHFKQNALYTLLQSVAIIGFQYFLFCLSPSHGLVFGLTLGYLTANIYMFIKTKKSIMKRESHEELRLVARRYINFPKYFTLANFIESFSNNLPILFLTPLFSIQEIGLYGLAHKVMAHGMQMLSGNIHNVIKADMAEKKGIRRIWPAYCRLLISLAGIGGIICIAIAFFAPKIFSIVFGSEWINSGYIARILLPVSFASLLRGMGNATTRVFEMTKYMLGFSIISVILKSMALFIAYLCTKDFNTVILVYSLAACGVILGGEIYLSLCIRKHDSNLSLYPIMANKE